MSSAVPDRPEDPAAGSDGAASGPSDEEQVKELKDRGSFTRYRVMAFITGTFLLLVCLEMFLKYGLSLNGVDAAGNSVEVLGDWIAIVHGWIYIVYLLAVADLWMRMRWGLGRLTALILGGVIPVMSFVIERNARVWVDETIAARSGSPSPSAAAGEPNEA